MNTKLLPLLILLLIAHFSNAAELISIQKLAVACFDKEENLYNKIFNAGNELK